MARAQGAEVIDFEEEHPVETMKRLTNGIGVDRAIDAVGLDAVRAHHGPASKLDAQTKKLLDDEAKATAPKQNPDGDNWHPGDGPSQALIWAVEGLAKAGTLSIIGVYGDSSNVFPIGQAMNKNLTLKMGNCNHRRYVPRLVDMVRSGLVDPATILTQREPMMSAIDAYKAFDQRQPGWIKVMLEPERISQAA